MSRMQEIDGPQPGRTQIPVRQCSRCGRQPWTGDPTLRIIHADGRISIDHRACHPQPKPPKERKRG